MTQDIRNMGYSNKSHTWIDTHADVDGEGWPEPEASAPKPETTAQLLLSIVACITALSYNICAILVGHVALRYITIYPLSSHTFFDADLTTTLYLAIIGSAVLAIPLFVATTLAPDSADVPISGSSEARQIAAAPVPRGLVCPVPPRVHAFLWEAWMISAAPMGSLLYDAIFLELDPGSCLNAQYAAFAGAAGRLILLATRRVWRSSLLGAPPDIDAKAAIEQLPAEKQWMMGPAA